ncbi:MAG: Hpt domain-containing protein [Oligoflexales bacterium]|nr:Hpt domain-containing protein [Oligoflexales bacterium]
MLVVGKSSFTSSAYWVRLLIENNSGKKRDFYLEVAYHYHDFIDFYEFDQYGAMQITKTGDQYPYRQRVIDHHNFVFPITLEHNENRLIVMRFKSVNSMLLPFTIWNPKSFHAQKERELIGLGLYYGMIVVMIFYNFFLLVTIRNSNYLVYVCYVVSYLIFQSGVNGLDFRFLWPENNYLANFSIFISLSFVNIFLTLFTQVFLHTRTLLPGLHRLINILIYPWTVIGLFVAIIGSGYSGRIILGFQPIAGIILLSTGVISLARGYRAARFYVIAFTLLLIASMVFALKSLGVLPSNILTEYVIIQLGSATEIVLLSLALGDKIRMEQRQAQNEIEDLNNNLERKVEEKTKDIKSILANIHQGIFTLHNENDIPVIDADFSEHLADILETRDIAGKSVTDIVFDNTNLLSDQLSMIKNAILFCIGDTWFNYDMNSIHLPREVEKYFENGSTKILEIDWCPVMDNKNETVQKILVTIRDVTTLRGLQARTKMQQDELSFISELIAVSGEQFLELLQTIKQLVDENKRLIESATIRDDETLKVLFINMHTIKGIGRSFGFVKMTTVVHECEQYYFQLKNDENQPWDKKKLQEDLKQVEDILSKYVNINNNKLGRGELSDKILVKKSVVENTIKSIKSFTQQSLPDHLREPLAAIHSDLSNFIYRRSKDILADVFKNVGTLARDLKKESPNIDIKCDDFSVTQFGSELIKNVFVHIVRNSMDHGIETPEERLKKGKDPAGTIYVDLSLNKNNEVTIHCRDDGSGINIQKLREIGQKMGLLTEPESSDPEKVANLIFCSGVSTSKSVSDISGRGVGMTAIKEYVEKSGGRIFLKLNMSSDSSSAYVPFEIEMTAPADILVA